MTDKNKESKDVNKKNSISEFKTMLSENLFGSSESSFSKTFLEETPKDKRKHGFLFSRKKNKESADPTLMLERKKSMAPSTLSKLSSNSSINPPPKKPDLFHLDLTLDPSDMSNFVNTSLSKKPSISESTFKEESEVFATPKTFDLPEEKDWEAPDSWQVSRNSYVFPVSKSSGSVKKTIDKKERSFVIRIFRANNTFTTILCHENIEAIELYPIIAKKFLIQEYEKYRLYIEVNGLERPLDNEEKPVKLLLEVIIQYGFNNTEEEISEILREDTTFLCKFSFKEATLRSKSPNIEEKLESVETIVIKYANLEAVPIFLFKISHLIENLDLSYNPGISIPDDFTKNCRSLNKLRLCRNDFKTCPITLSNLMSLKSMDLSSNKIETLQRSKIWKLKNLIQLRIGNNLLTEIQDDFGNLSYLTHLDLSCNNFEVFPLNLCYINSLKRLNLSHNKIKEIPKEISQLENLVELGLMNNRFSGEISKEINLLDKILEIDLRYNKFINVDSLFESKSLKKVRLDHNEIEKVSICSSKIAFISLSHCCIFSITIKEKLEFLTHIDASNCKINSIDTLNLSLCPNLIKLNLDYNEIKKLPDVIFEGLNKLEIISISNNTISALPSNIFGLKNLSVLDVHNNIIKRIPHEIWTSPKLEAINLSSNQLIDFPTFRNHRMRSSSLDINLVCLLLGDNQLSDNIFDVISGLSSLNILNLSYNNIYDIPHNAFQNLNDLDELYLSGNQISSLPQDDLKTLRNLKLLHLNCNKLSTLPAELGKLGNLVVLDVGNNQLKYNISNWSFDWNWNWNVGLRYLNFSGNKKFEIKETVGGSKPSPLPNMNNGNLSNFDALNNLRVLGLIDVTVLIGLPDQTDNRRVRTSGSNMNGLKYGIADKLDSSQNICGWDFAIPDFKPVSHNSSVTKSSSNLRISSSHDQDISLFMILDTFPFKGKNNPQFLAFVSARIKEHLSSELIKSSKAKINKQLGTTTSRIKTSEKFAIKNAFINTQKDINFSSFQNYGLSCIIAYLKDDILYIANIGDTLAVISENGGKARLISQLHKPLENESELLRVRESGVYINADGAVNNKFPLSRCLGVCNNKPGISSLPHIEKIKLNNDHEFVILANRSIWNFISYQTAVDIVKTEPNDLMVAAQKLRDFCIAYGCQKSILVMILNVQDLFTPSIKLQRKNTNKAKQYRIGNGLSIDIQSPVTKSKKADYFGTWKKNKQIDANLNEDLLYGFGAEINAPEGCLALVFTDIKNSTHLWENSPKAMQQAVKTHNVIMRKYLRLIGGYEVKTEGDAFMISFSSVASATLWCITVQLQLLQADWPQEILDIPECKETFDTNNPSQVIYRGLSVRMGINYGSPLCEQDPITRRMDYFGPMVNKAARVQGYADGGEICISTDVFGELVNYEDLFEPPNSDPLSLENTSIGYDTENSKNRRDIESLREIGLRVVEIGEKKLKGLENPETLFLLFPKVLSSRSKVKEPSTKNKSEIHDKHDDPNETFENLVNKLSDICCRLEILSMKAMCDTQSEYELFGSSKEIIQSFYSMATFVDISNVFENMISRIENSVTKIFFQSLGNVDDILDAILEVTE